MSSHLTRDVLFRGSTVECRPENDPPRCKRTFRLILLGPPGVGKGTQAEMLCRKLQTCHVSTGDLFRAAQCQETPSPAMAAALEVMRRGELVPDELVMSVVQERLRSLRADEGFLLDGVPRPIEQAKGLADLLGDTRLSIYQVLHAELPLK